jgi:ADP-heptose:LPS heptosyltransferase
MQPAAAHAGGFHLPERSAQRRVKLTAMAGRAHWLKPPYVNYALLLCDTRVSPKHTMKRILVVRIDFLGDMVCTTPLLRRLKERWPGAEIHVLANKYNRAVLEGNPDVSVVHTYVYSKQFERNPRPGKINAIRDRLSLILRLRKQKFDLLVIPNGGMHKNSIQFARLLNAKTRRWHTADTEFDDRKPEHVASRPIRHEALSGFRIMPELGQVEPDELRLHVYPSSQLQAEWERKWGPKVKPRVGLFVSNKAAERRWDERKWCQLALELSERADVIIFNDPLDRDTEVYESVSAARRIVPATVPDLVAAMSLLDIAVSADSAPVHLAAALRLRVVALFEDRPEKYLRWHPLGVPHVLLRAGPTVDDIAVDAVEKAVTGLIAELRFAPIAAR